MPTPGVNSDDEIDEDEDEEYYCHEYDEDDSDDEYDDYEDTGCGGTGDEKTLTSLTKDQLLLCSTSLKGYSLKTKKWRMYSFPNNAAN